jgi:type VI secretion system secreted protein Hcp
LNFLISGVFVFSNSWEEFMKNSLRLLCFIVLFVCTGTYAAETVHLTLTGKSQGWIKGDPTHTSLGRADTIECIGYTHVLNSIVDDAGQPTGRNNHHAISILKRIDKSSVKLFRAMRNTEPCTAVFKFFRPSPTGDGSTEQFYTVTLEGAFITGIRQEVANTADASTSNYAPMERVSFTYNAVVETYYPVADECGDEWRYVGNKVPFSDINFDGIVNMKDFAIMADDWMIQY